MKALLVAIQPKWLKMILEGKKKVEFRNWKVPVGTVIYFYCTKAKPYLYHSKAYENHDYNDENLLNGKVVAKAVVNNLFKIGVADRPFYDKKKLRSWSKWEVLDEKFRKIMGWDKEGFFTWMPINVDELTPYGYTDQKYALELSQVEEIEPKDVTEFVSWKRYNQHWSAKLAHNDFARLTQPPQSRTWVYIHEN